MKYDISILTRAIDSAKGCILGKQQVVRFGDKQYKSWPLFMADSLNNSDDVDVCAIGIGVIALCSDYKNDNSNIEPISQGINTILSIRNDDGSWPSKISLVTKNTFRMEGVISDTFYAISALISVGFLTNNSIVSEFINLNDSTVYDTIEKRISYIEKSVDWLLENRVENCQGWQYTGVHYLENKDDKERLPAYTMPTVNAILILYKIKTAVRAVNPNHTLINKINIAVENSINWLSMVQASTQSDYGFGIKRGDRSRVSNTARVLATLSEIELDDLNDNLKIKMQNLQIKAIKWLLDNYKPRKISFEDVSEDFTQMFIEIKSKTGAIKNVFRRPIIHETYLEPVIIDALYYYYNRNKDNITLIQKRKIFFVMNKALLSMLTAQSANGDTEGAIACRRQSNFEKYTMYSTGDSICTLSKLIKDPKLVKKIGHSNILYKIKFYMFIIFALIAIIIPIFIGTDKYFYTLPGSLILGILTNIISDKLFKN